jgi:hypothetical protein
MPGARLRDQAGRAAAVLVEFVGVALLTLAVSSTMTVSLALGVAVPPPLRAEWQQLFVHLAFAASLLPALLLAAALNSVP